MIFHSFPSQQERRRFGGSAFLELSYCRMPSGTTVKEIVSVRAIENWKDDSLYVYLDDLDIFFVEYNGIFNDGTYNNLKSGPLDLWGINYYSPSQVVAIMQKIETCKPKDDDILLKWLQRADKANGIYVLGI
ncbi:MAG: hypothetical protein IKG32_11915 [Clostridia bacterium]|nr:hypothetical protein [Clostridia bacterium]